MLFIYHSNGAEINARFWHDKSHLMCVSATMYIDFDVDAWKFECGTNVIV